MVQVGYHRGVSRAQITGKPSYRLPLPDQLKATAIEQATREGISLAALIRKAIKEYLERA